MTDDARDAERLAEEYAKRVAPEKYDHLNPDMAESRRQDIIQDFLRGYDAGRASLAAEVERLKKRNDELQVLYDGKFDMYEFVSVKRTTWNNIQSELATLREENLEYRKTFGAVKYILERPMGSFAARVRDSIEALDDLSGDLLARRRGGG